MDHINKKDFIESLDSMESKQVLSWFYNKFPELENEIYDIALKVVSQVDEDSIMAGVFQELDMIDVDDLYDGSGSTRYGYVDPTDLSWEMFGDVLQPFLNEMEKSQKRNLPIEAKAYCCGIIKGLQKYSKESNSEFSDWAPDAPEEFIHTALEEFKKGNPRKEDIAQVSKLVQLP